MLIILLRFKKLDRILKIVSLKLMIESKLLGIKILLVKLILKIDHKKYLLSILC